MKVDLCVIIRAKMIRVGDEDGSARDHHCGGRGDLCDHHRSQGDDGGDWFVDERSVIITAMMALQYVD